MAGILNTTVTMENRSKGTDDELIAAMSSVTVDDVYRAVAEAFPN